MAKPDRWARRVRWALLAGPATVLLLTGCAALDRSPDPGPLGQDAGQESGEFCVPASPAGQYALGVEVLRNPSPEDAVITGLELVDADGLELVEAVVADVADRTAVGTQTSWPPDTVAQTREWKARVPAEGATIPARSRQKNLVLHLAADGGKPASLGSYKVAYTSGGNDYELQTTFALRIKEKCF